jgi:type I restriction enzyme R subunit
MSTSSLTEADICDQYITPAIVQAGWDQATQVRREYSFTAGRVNVHGQLAARGTVRRLDYLLFYQNDRTADLCRIGLLHGRMAHRETIA